MCCVLPTPEEAYLKSPGLAFIAATSSATVLTGTWLPTTSTLGTVTIMPTAVRSLSGSKLSLSRCGAIACPVLVATSRVWPSAGALAVRSAAIVLDAPGRFSTMKLPLRPSAIFSASRRAMMSVPPPALAPTMILTGLVG